MNMKKKNERGITLIVLVITIIVTLILAGVTISGLNGENGIITKSKEAKIKAEKSRTIEKINLVILTVMTEGDGDIDTGKLREELEKEGLTVKTEGNNLPWDVSDGKYIYRINEDYTVEEVEGINLSKKEIKLISGENETITSKLNPNALTIGFARRFRIYIRKSNNSNSRSRRKRKRNSRRNSSNNNKR